MVSNMLCSIFYSPCESVRKEIAAQNTKYYLKMFYKMINIYNYLQTCTKMLFTKDCKNVELRQSTWVGWKMRLLIYQLNNVKNCYTIISFFKLPKYNSLIKKNSTPSCWTFEFPRMEENQP